MSRRPGKESARTLKVVGKYAVKGNKIMARLLDGTVARGAAKDVQVNDSVVLDKGAIKKTLKFEEGAKCLVIRGTHSAETGTIKEISKGTRRPRADSQGRERRVRVRDPGGQYHDSRCLMMPNPMQR